MKHLLFCGDPHGTYDHIVRVAGERRPVGVILLGDLTPQRPLKDELGVVADNVWFIHGNHDSDSEEAFGRVFTGDMAARNLHGRIQTMPDGTRIAGLGGIFRDRVWMPPALPLIASQSDHIARDQYRDRWYEGERRRRFTTIYPETLRQLASQKADILVSHEAPSCHPHGHTAIDELARAMGVKAVFHGHHHDRLDYSKWRGRLGFSAFGVGLCGITDGDGTPIVLGELDLIRRNRPRLAEEEGDE